MASSVETQRKLKFLKTPNIYILQLALLLFVTTINFHKEPLKYLLESILSIKESKWLIWLQVVSNLQEVLLNFVHMLCSQLWCHFHVGHSAWLPSKALGEIRPGKSDYYIPREKSDKQQMIAHLLAPCWCWGVASCKDNLLTISTH